MPQWFTDVFYDLPLWKATADCNNDKYLCTSSCFHLKYHIYNNMCPDELTSAGHPNKLWQSLFFLLSLNQG